MYSAWSEQARGYRKYLFMQAGTHTKHGRVVREEKIAQVLEADGVHWSRRSPADRMTAEDGRLHV